MMAVDEPVRVRVRARARARARARVSVRVSGRRANPNKLAVCPKHAGSPLSASWLS